MDSDDLFSTLDWDPVYLSSIFDQEFNDFTDLWNSCIVSDSKLLEMTSDSGSYCPVVEDISIEHEVLVTELNQIEFE